LSPALFAVAVEKIEFKGDHYIFCCGLIEDQPGGYTFAGDHARLTGEDFLASMHQA